MRYKIIVDSCCDLPKEYRNDERFEIVPLTIEIDNDRLIDDATLNQGVLLEKMRRSSNSPKTSCPSPEDYMRAYTSEAEDVYVVTLSDKLSGSYNSAALGAKLFKEDHEEKNIAVFNSFSASVGEVVIAYKIFELAEAGHPFEYVKEHIEKFIQEMRTLFVLESLDNLRKNGRLSNIQALIANVLNIKPVMVGNPDGTIGKLDQARGIKKALTRMATAIESEGKNLQDKVLGIAHCNCYERALAFKDEILKICTFKDVFIVETAGISSVYTNDGGIVVAF